MYSHFDGIGAQWAAFDELSRRMVQMTHGFNGLHAGSGKPASSRVSESDEAYRYSVDIPGVSPDGIALEVTERGFTLSVESESRVPEGFAPRKRERRGRKFKRSGTFDVPVDADSVTASLADGVLRIEFPKRPEAAPRAVPIEVG